MIRYVPFLKAKRGERNAIGDLSPEVKEAICPFFDFPRKIPDHTAASYATICREIAKSLKKHWGTDAEFYFDDYDVAPQTLEVDGEHQYAYVLKALNELKVIPVVGLDRIPHNAAVSSLKRNGEIDSTIVVFRAEQSDFEDFDADQIDYEMVNVFKQFEAIDLVLDCRVCVGLDISMAAQQIAVFSQKFCSVYPVRRIIVSGSSIPPTIRDILGTDDHVILPRREFEIIAKARGLVNRDLVVGDYAIVSPFFSEKNIDPMLFQKITAPRLIYSFDHSHYIARGISLALGGHEQYAGLTSELCEKEFFRTGYSTGEEYFYEKSQRIGKNANNGSVVRPSVVAHITYMALESKF
ncbi:MAG: hypothetical protein WCP60_02740 [bacterium]